MTISSRAELEGAQTSTCDFRPTSLPTLTGLLTLSSPNASRYVGVLLGGSQGLIASLHITALSHCQVIAYKS